MRLSQVGELALLEKIRARFPKKSRAVLTGIGDDAAVLKVGSGEFLATSDMMVEGVHFERALVTPFQLGFKLVSVNVSDIYAMGGKPRFVLLDIAAPGETGTPFIDGLLNGVAEATERYGMSLVGGDVSSSRDGIVLTATVIGKGDNAVKRSGAKPGDGIYVTGTLGDSACGLALLRAIGGPVDLTKARSGPLEWAVMRPLLERHLVPEARKPGSFIKRATAMIDISDGLFIDLTRICTESKVGARVYEDKIPMSNGMKAAAACLGKDPLAFATAGGEDYELLFTAPSGKRIKAHLIGEVTGSGIVYVDGDGAESPVRPEGYRHFG